MRQGQFGVSRAVVAVGILVVLVLLGTGGAVVARVGPFAGSAPAGGGSPAALAKPADAKQAVVDATGRTATFKDVKYTTASTFNNANTSTTTKAEISATTNPVMIDSRLTTSAGKMTETITNQAAGVYCTHPADAPAQRFTDQNIAADAADPFSGMVKGTKSWRYFDDTDVNGHKDWQVVGDQPLSVTGANPNKIQYDLSTVTVWIDSRSGKIEKRVDHSTGSENGVKFDQTLTYANFVYDSGGITIPPCN